MTEIHVIAAEALLGSLQQPSHDLICLSDNILFRKPRHDYSEAAQTGNRDGRQTEAIEAVGLMAKL